MFYVCSQRLKLKIKVFSLKIKQVWHWPYEAPGIVDSGLNAITIVCGPKDMSLKKYKHYGC